MLRDDTSAVHHFLLKLTQEKYSVPDAPQSVVGPFAVMAVAGSNLTCHQTPRSLSAGLLCSLSSSSLYM